MTETVRIGPTVIRVTKKDIKHVHLSVHPPGGEGDHHRAAVDTP